MFKNYLVTALRNLLRHKLYAAINIGGLAIGLAACILIFLYVRNELNYDKFWPEADSIYRLDVNIRVPGRLPETFAVTTAQAKAALEKDFSEIKSVTRFFPAPLVVSQGDDIFFEQVTFADKNFFEIFELPFVAGSPETTLGDTASIGISEKMAKKYFGDANAINQTIDLTFSGTKRTYRVAGVFEDLPQNTHLFLDMIILLNRDDFLSPNGNTFLDSWGATSLYTYIKFHPHADIAAIENELDAFTDRNAPQNLAEIFGVKVSEVYDHYLTSVQDIHLEGAQSDRITPGGDAVAVKSFIAIAILILLVSSLNFINLTTARSILRSKEISLRKVMGAARKQIIVQFLSETVVIMALALTVALALVEMSLPWFNDFISTLVAPQISSDPTVLLGLLGLLLVVSLGAGFYPSFVVSGFKPADILRPGQTQTAFSARLRNVFVVLQFSISIGLIISTAVIYFQTSYAKTLDLGFEKESILVLRGVFRDDVQPNIETLVIQLERHPDIMSATGSSAVPFDVSNNFGSIRRLDAPDETPQGYNFRFVDPAYFSTYGIEINTGRDFLKEFGTDMVLPEPSRAAVVVNEAAIMKLGFGSAEESLGQVVMWGTQGWELQIIGVIPDIHIMPATYEDEPMFYVWDPTGAGSLSIRFKTDNIVALQGFVDDTWKKVIPGVPIQHVFLDEQIGAAYENAEARGIMFAVFSILAILVSSLGLYGLASFATERRAQEIGLRKVMGADSSAIIKMMLWQFSQPILLANLVAWPVAWFFMSDWLSGFVFRIDLSPVYFIVAGGAALLIGWITVAGHAWKIASTNPIHALSYE